VSEPFFLPAPGGPRYCLFHPPAGGTPRGAVLYLHPFAEEMNKSRRMAARQSRQLAAAGFAVLQVDLLGCGDSAGDFGDATWPAWQDDVLAAAQWLRSRTDAPLWLWGLRLGCLLAVQAAPALGGSVNFLFWQPVASGKQYLQQFLRLKLAGDLIAGDGGAGEASPQQQLAAGQAVEIAGYRLAPALADPLARAELEPPAGAGRLVWLETSGRPDPQLSPAAGKWLERWRQADFQVASAAIGGPAFWQTTEIEESPALLAATLAALAEAAP